jgi:hypothetical protein
MRSVGAERPMDLGAWTLSTPWGALDRTQVRELALPGALIGPLGGLIAGGFAAMGGQSVAVIVTAFVGLGVPLALGGAAYEILLATGRFPLGTLAPAALLWAVAFPVACAIAAALVDLVAGTSVAVPNGWLAFLVYQVLVAVPFAIGFWWLHENFVPRWWFHIRERNPVADHFIRNMLAYAAEAEAEEAAAERRRAAKRHAGTAERRSARERRR